MPSGMFTSKISGFPYFKVYTISSHPPSRCLTKLFMSVVSFNASLLCRHQRVIKEGPVPPHRMHNNRQLARHSDKRLFMAAPFLNGEAPTLDRQAALITRQHSARRRVKRPPNIAVPRLGDAAFNIDRATRLPTFGRQAKIGPDIARAFEAGRIIHTCHKGQRRHRPNAGYLHKTPRQLCLARYFDNLRVQLFELRPQPRTRVQHCPDQLARKRLLRR